MKKTTKRHVLIYIFYPSFRCFPQKNLRHRGFHPPMRCLVWIMTVFFDEISVVKFKFCNKPGET